MGDSSEPAAAYVLDISTSGIRVRVNFFLATGTEATLHFNNTIATGHVRYCRSNQDDSFDAGLQLVDVLTTI